MPNTLTSTGLTTATQAEWVTLFTNAYQAIYGASINLGANTPDGQMMMIYIQALLDVQDLVTQVFNSFDPDNAIGVVLDQRVAINGIQRQSGTFTTTNITLVTSQSLNLYGLDQTLQPIYTVADNAGNQWQLQTTVLGLAAGTNVLVFQAANPGAVLATPNTITVPVSIILGVTSINNPTSYTTLGINEESDNALKIRRQKSVTLPSQGYLPGLLAALENIPGVTFAFIEENTTNTTNSDGVPAHSIWVIVAGSGANSAIANAIYTKRNAGCGMYGSISYAITQVDGSVFLVSWDVVSTVPIFAKFNVTSLDGVNPPNITAIVSRLTGVYSIGVASEVNVNDLATFVRQIDPNSLVTSPGFSLTTSGFANTLTPALKKNQFTLPSTNIIVLPMILSPAGGTVTSAGASSVTVTNSTTCQMTSLGGYGALTYTLPTNGSGGSISASGLYTAGSTHPTTDIARVTDSLGNVANCTITVT